MAETVKGTRYFKKGNDICSYSGELLTSKVKRELREEGWKGIDKDVYSGLLTEQRNTYQPTVKLEHGTNINV